MWRVLSISRSGEIRERGTNRSLPWIGHRNKQSPDHWSETLLVWTTKLRITIAPSGTIIISQKENP